MTQNLSTTNLPFEASFSLRRPQKIERSAPNKATKPTMHAATKKDDGRAALAAKDGRNWKAESGDREVDLCIIALNFALPSAE